MLADPKVKQGMKIFEALQNGTYTTAPTTMAVAMSGSAVDPAAVGTPRR